MGSIGIPEQLLDVRLLWGESSSFNGIAVLSGLQNGAWADQFILNGSDKQLFQVLDNLRTFVFPKRTLLLV